MRSRNWFLAAMFLCAACAAPGDVRESNMALTQDRFARLPNGSWMSLDHDESIISDEQYQALAPNPIDQYLNRTQILMGQDPESGRDWYREEQAIKAPQPGQTARGVVQQIVQQYGTGSAHVLGLLGNAGYFDQFADWPEIAQQVGEFTAQGQRRMESGPEGLMKGSYIHLGNMVDDLGDGRIPGFGGESSNVWGQPSGRTYNEMAERGADPAANQWMHDVGKAIALAATGAGISNAMGAAGGAAGASGGSTYGIGEFAGGGSAGGAGAGAGAGGGIAEQYANLAGVNQATQADIMAGTQGGQSFQVAQAPGTMTDVSAGLSGSGFDPMTAHDIAQGNALSNAGVNAPPPNFQLPSGEWAYGPQGAPSAAPQDAPNEPQMPPAEPEVGLPPKETALALPALKDVLQTSAAAAALAAAVDGGDGPDPLEGEDPHETEEERQARIAASTAAVNQAFGGYNDQYYTGIADAYRNYQTPIFQDQVSNARRRLPMSVPHTQSSAYNRKASDLELDIQRGETNLGRDALGEANRRRGEVEMTRGELLNLAQSGADTETVAQQASQRAALYAAPPEFSPIADLFEKYSNNALTAVLANRKQPQAQISRPLTFSHSPGSSVRNIS